jgi:tripartite-type tricarboxylate transporter receptor subunit TctC
MITPDLITLEGENMNSRLGIRRSVLVAGTALVSVVSLSACGSVTAGGGTGDGSDFPTGPVTLNVGQAAGGSTDLIARAVASGMSEDLDVAMPVVNKPGANGALATQEVIGQPADGHNLILLNASLITVTPLAVGEDEAVDLEDLDIIGGLSRDDYVLITHVDTEYETVEDIVSADGEITYGTAGVGTASQLAQAALFAQADIEGRDIPFDSGAPAMAAVLGKQVEMATVQLGEAMPQIEAGTLRPIVVFSEERNEYLPDTPTAVEAGYDVPVSQYRAIAAPAGTPEPAKERLREALEATFDTEEYQQFNEQNMLTPEEISGEQVEEDWARYAEEYRTMAETYDIDLGGGN